MPSIILYSTLDQKLAFRTLDHWRVPVGGTNVYIRAEMHPGNIDEALNDAKPRDGETVLNTIPLVGEVS